MLWDSLKLELLMELWDPRRPTPAPAPLAIVVSQAGFDGDPDLPRF
jgi:hypothetical protein